MVHDIATINGSSAFAFRGDKAWHGLGQQINASDDLATIAGKAGLAWTALALSRAAMRDDGSPIALAGRALVRSDTLADAAPVVLGEVSDQYKVVQPGDVLATMQTIASELGGELETAGALNEGRRIFGLVRFPDDLIVGREDRVARYATVYTSFDGTLATCVSQTSIRIVCANTLRASIAQEASMASRGLIRFTHSQKSQIDASSVAALAAQWQAFAEWTERAANADMSASDMSDFEYALAAAVVRGETLSLGAVSADRQENDGLASLGRKLGKRGKSAGVDDEVLALARSQARVDEIRAALARNAASGPGAMLDGARGTLWGAINAATYTLGTLGEHMQRRTASALEGLTAERLGIGAPKWESALSSLVDEILSRPPTSAGIAIDDIMALETDTSGAVRAGVLS